MGCHSARKCTGVGSQVTCGNCGAGFSNDGAKGCKATCTPSVCREHRGASPDKPGAGSRDDDCCGTRGNTGCDVGYVHSIIKDAEWAKIGGRPAGFKNCDVLGGATCCTKGVDPCKTNNGGCHGARKCTTTGFDLQVTCGNCPAGLENDGAKGCKAPDPCKTNNGGCDSKRACTSTGGVATCGGCSAGFTNDGAKGCKANPKPTPAAPETNPCKTPGCQRAPAFDGKKCPEFK